MKRRVVVTGMGVVTPIGIGLAAFREGLNKGRSGISLITRFDASNFPVKKSAEVKNFNARTLGTHLLDPFIQYAVAAAKEALDVSGFHPNQIDPYRIGLSVSSSKGGMHTLDRFRERLKNNPSAILGARVYTSLVPNFAAQWIARRWKIKGAAKCYVAACATGTTAIIEGAKMVAYGDVDYCIAGASDASIVPVLLAGYRKMKVTAKERIRPFDKNRDGFVVGEGAGIVLIETLESAKARGAKIYGEIRGFAYGSDPNNSIHFNDNDDALSRTLQRTINESNLVLEDIDYINLHGTGTRAGDAYEVDQIKRLWQSKACHIPMSSTKSMTGHMLGASGAVEVITSLLAMNGGFLPPTIGLEEPEESFDLDFVANKSREKKIQHALSFSMGFGGHLAAITLGKI